jgi:hypothetical protein
MRQKIVLRMRDGRLKKCTTFSHFSAAFAKIKVLTIEGWVETVNLSDVKAIFFVREFEGNPAYKARKDFHEGSPKAGRAVTVRFADGEVMRGKVINLAEKSGGFFLFPADPNDNNLKVFVVRAQDTIVEVEE